ncbi:phosphatase 2C-like domain-containing protein [Aspergillus ambiguus]|uniref:type 2C protein phosphatase PTC7 n=1 Tax=Aspergillus ambiguus TaxID=176160 RepID=UPI003CCDAFD8
MSSVAPSGGLQIFRHALCRSNSIPSLTHSISGKRRFPRRSFNFSTTSTTSSAFRCRLAASVSSKNDDLFYPITNTYDFTSYVSDAIGVTLDSTDPDLNRKRRPNSGEDAFFVSRIGPPHSSEAVAFAIADGVGSWAHSDIDPADFSHSLCSYMAQCAVSWAGPAEHLRAKHLMQVGYDRLLADPFVTAGGSTASVGIVQEDGRVDLASLGDSGCILLRRGAVHYYTIPQHHAFNTPYQLSIIPRELRRKTETFGRRMIHDKPRHAGITNLQLEHGDVLIMASDGVFDNLSNQDILKIINHRMVAFGGWTTTIDLGIKPTKNLARLTAQGGLSPFHGQQRRESSNNPLTPNPLAGPNQITTLQSFIAATIVGEAKHASKDARRDGPFAKQAQRYFPEDPFRGGKIDDISAVVLIAVKEGYGDFS